jgi:WXG100 family type VII secretion target
MVLIQAEFAAFRAAEQSFARALRELETTLDRLEHELDQSLAEWDGEARNAYTTAQARWDKSSRELHAELARLHKAIARAHLNFRSSSSTNVRMWSA